MNLKTITNLPEEIILEMFQYLSLDDRKFARLVCKKWFEICNSASILKNEALSCNGVYSISDIYKLLANSKRQLLNLRFRNIKFIDDEVPFWELDGWKIRWISFTDCDFGDGIFEKIVVFCENLSHLSLLYSSQYNQDILSFGVDLKKLTIVRNNLKSLEINVLDSRWTSNYTIYYLFSLFPDLKTLKISCTVVDKNFETFNLELEELQSCIKFSFSPILYYLIQYRQIRHLKLHFPTNEFSIEFIRRIFETLSAMNGLTKLSINIRGTPLFAWIELFFHSKRLKSLEYCIKMDYSAEKFLVYLLNRNPDLRHLKVSLFNKLDVTSIFFEKLRSSNLKTLIIDDKLIAFNSQFSALKNATNVNLCDLRVYTERSQNDVQLFLLQYFKNLHHLELSNLTADVLQSVLKHQTKLRSLILHDCDSGSLRSFLNADDENQLTENATCYSFKNLSKLEYLELLSCSTEKIFSKIFLSKSTLLNLKYFRISINGDSKVNSSDLLSALDLMPFLQSFYLCSGNDITFDTWMKLCIKLKCLRYLYINCGLRDTKFTDMNYRKLFTLRSSLRVLVHDSNSGQILASYYLNTVCNEIHSKCQNYIYPFNLPKIGKFIVDWMNF